MDPNIAVYLDGRSSLRFVQGEDRLFSVAFFDKNAGAPVDLTGGSVFVLLPAAAGGVIKRRSGPLALSSAMVPTPASGILYANHGLVTGDPVTFAGLALPAPLVAGTPYFVRVVDSNTFQLTDAAGADVTLTSSGTGVFTMTNAADLTIPNPGAGLAALSLRSLVSAVIAPGIAQDFEFGVIVAGKIRIVVVSHGLDVIPQTG